MLRMSVSVTGNIGAIVEGKEVEMTVSKYKRSGAFKLRGGAEERRPVKALKLSRARERDYESATPG